MLEHVLVPKHELMTEDEVKELLEKYNVTKDQLPQIIDDDPGIEHLEAKAGDVIRILRENPVTGKSLYYRVVIEG